MTMTKQELQKRLEEWQKKVLSTYGHPADTDAMLIEADKIISEAFNHSPLFSENR